MQTRDSAAFVAREALYAGERFDTVVMRIMARGLDEVEAFRIAVSGLMEAGDQHIGEGRRRIGIGLLLVVICGGLTIANLIAAMSGETFFVGRLVIALGIAGFIVGPLGCLRGMAHLGRGKSLKRTHQVLHQLLHQSSLG